MQVLQIDLDHLNGATDSWTLQRPCRGIRGRVDGDSTESCGRWATASDRCALPDFLANNKKGFRPGMLALENGGKWYRTTSVYLAWGN